VETKIPEEDTACILRGKLPYGSLQMEAAYPFKKLVLKYQTTGYPNPELELESITHNLIQNAAEKFWNYESESQLQRMK
jgi:hypothetical protein